MPGDNGSLRRRHENDPTTNGNIGELEAPSLQLDHAHDQTRDPSDATEQGTTAPEHSENFDVDYGSPKGPLKQQIVKFCRKTFTVQNFLNKFPIIKWLPKYRCQDFQGDLIAGLTVGLTVIPQGLAYAQVANLPAQYGLYSAFVGCFVYCILGSAKDITMGPTTAVDLCVLHGSRVPPPVNGFNGSSYSVFPSDSSAKSTSTLNIGPYDDIVPSQISLKDRAKSCCRSCFTLDTLKKRLPIIVWLPQYNLLKLAYDLIAGITVGLTIIPQSLAFAGIAGLAPQLTGFVLSTSQYGLYCGVICCFVYVLMGSAKDITLGPSAITSLLTAAFATSFSPKLPNGDTDPTMAIMLTLTTGLIHIFMGVFKLGILVSFISFPVINAFSSAAAITIAVSQLRTLLGLKGVPNDFVAALDNIRQRLPYINVWDMTMGMSCILVVVLIKKLREIKFKDDPNKPTPKYILLFRQVVLICGSASTAIVVILASIILYILESNGIKAITPTGYIKPGLPEVRAPSFSIHIGNYTMGTSEMFSTIAPGIIVFPFITLIEAMAIGKYFARVNRYKLDPSQELLSYGVANLLTSFFQGYPITGTFSRY
uniref:SLC26A/SulP transporter domain-containing protein n=1 Tax=Biomphalaria glabrata TaxID=6526 RepID=A0A2C9LUP3_BIOGL